MFSPCRCGDSLLHVHIYFKILAESYEGEARLFGIACKQVSRIAFDNEGEVYDLL